MYTRIFGYILAWVLVLLLAGCTGKPDGFEPVEGFDLDRYLGTWYEIARLDHSFERGLDFRGAIDLYHCTFSKLW